MQFGIVDDHVLVVENVLLDVPARHARQNGWRDLVSMMIGPNHTIQHRRQKLMMMAEAAHDLAYDSHDPFIADRVDHVSMAFRWHHLSEQVASAPAFIRLFEAAPYLAQEMIEHFPVDAADQAALRSSAFFHLGYAGKSKKWLLIRAEIKKILG
ncbi:MAG TPA: hypothetical protein VGX03_22925 [Candidatus Binatia bacterium]|jgi:hypothetical protein|nr:hypothetical protein [Candidatus Binatia bacterium]